MTAAASLAGRTSNHAVLQPKGALFSPIFCETHLEPMSANTVHMPAEGGVGEGERQIAHIFDRRHALVWTRYCRHTPQNGRPFMCCRSLNLNACTLSLLAGPGAAMRRPAPTLADVLDLIAPHLDDQRDRCRVQATCRGLRNAGLRSEVVNRLVVGRDRSDEERRSFLLWLGPRAHAVRRLNYCASCM